MTAACADCGEMMTGGYGQEMCWPCHLSAELAEAERKLAAARASAAKGWAQAGCSAEALTVARAQLERAASEGETLRAEVARLQAEVPTETQKLDAVLEVLRGTVPAPGDAGAWQRRWQSADAMLSALTRRRAAQVRWARRWKALAKELRAHGETRFADWQEALEERDRIHADRDALLMQHLALRTAAAALLEALPGCGSHDHHDEVGPAPKATHYDVNDDGLAVFWCCAEHANVRPGPFLSPALPWAEAGARLGELMRGKP